jgi:lipopolysaccharide export system protein LptA
MKRAPFVAMAVATLLAAGGAQAQLAGSKASGPLARGTGPMGINSDKFNYTPGNCQTTWTGRVEATQDQSRMRADEVVAFSHHEGASKDCVGQFDRLEATGNVYYVTPDLKAKGDKAIYLTSNDTVTITGRVIVTSDQGVSETNKLVLNVNTNEATMGEPSGGQRVKAVIYPNTAKKAPAAK